MKDHQAEVSGMKKTFEYKFQCATVCWFWYATAIDTDDYFVAGVVLAVSPVNESPSPSFFSKQLFEAVTVIQTK